MKVSSVETKGNENSKFGVNELLKCTLEVNNPLQIPISISNATLESFYSENPRHSVTSENLLKEDENEYVYDGFIIKKIENFKLLPLEKKELNFYILPKKPGTIYISALKYNFFCIPNRHSITKKTKSSSKEQGMFSVFIHEPMSLLSVSFKNFPEIIHRGQLQNFMIQFCNKGGALLRKIRVKVNRPEFFLFKSEKEKSNTEGDILSEDYEFSISNKLSDCHIDDLDMNLEPTQSITLPAWICAESIGKNVFNFIFEYQSGVKAAPWRVFTINQVTEVYPSLKVNAFTRPSQKSPSEYILGVEVRNQLTEVIDAIQFSSLSPLWKIYPLESAQNYSFLPQKTHFMYYRIKKLGKKQEITPESITSRELENFVMGKFGKVKIPDVDLTGHNIRCGDEDILCSTLPFLPFILNSRLKWKQSSLQRLYPTIPVTKFDSLFTLYNSNGKV